MPVATELFDGTRVVGKTIVHGTTFEVHHCGVCGVEWAMPAWYLEARQKDHASWFCPNKHSFWFSGPSDEELLKRDLAQVRDSLATERAARDQAEASLRATKGVVTKQRKTLRRVTAGVCPCCNRTFQNLGRHMEGQHPDYKP
jgi:hypothetical protein